MYIDRIRSLWALKPLLRALAQANALLVSASALASCQQLQDALCAAEMARGIYRDIGGCAACRYDVVNRIHHL